MADYYSITITWKTNAKLKIRYLSLPEARKKFNTLKRHPGIKKLALNEHTIVTQKLKRWKCSGATKNVQTL